MYPLNVIQINITTICIICNRVLYKTSRNTETFHESIRNYFLSRPFPPFGGGRGGANY